MIQGKFRLFQIESDLNDDWRMVDRYKGSMIAYAPGQPTEEEWLDFLADKIEYLDPGPEVREHIRFAVNSLGEDCYRVTIDFEIVERDTEAA